MRRDIYLRGVSCKDESCITINDATLQGAVFGDKLNARLRCCQVVVDGNARPDALIRSLSADRSSRYTGKIYVQPSTGYCVPILYLLIIFAVLSNFLYRCPPMLIQMGPANRIQSLRKSRKNSATRDRARILYQFLSAMTFLFT